MATISRQVQSRRTSFVSQGRDTAEHYQYTFVVNSHILEHLLSISNIEQSSPSSSSRNVKQERTRQHHPEASPDTAWSFRRASSIRRFRARFERAALSLFRIFRWYNRHARNSSATFFIFSASNPDTSG